MLCIESPNLSVKIKEKGAELCSIYDKEKERELLWQGDRRLWAEQAPILFPFIGRLKGKAYSYNGQKYPMDLHGFARENVFRVVEHNEDSCLLELRDTAVTRQAYPFAFRLRQYYRVKGTSLLIETKIENLGMETMYFALGLHPGFQLFSENNKISDFELDFPDCPGEKLEQILFSEESLTKKERGEAFLKEKSLSLSYDLFRNDASVFPETGGKAFLHKRGEKEGLRMEYPDYSYIAIWQPYGKEAPFLCIEPWTSLPGRDGIEEDICEKEDVQSLLPDEERSYHCKISLD